jgi:hypothetical protein
MPFLSSYLSDRSMKVKVADKQSGPCKVGSGVPQGSVIGPTLFIAFINAVAELKLSDHTNILLYADDIALIHPLVNNNSMTSIQSDIDKISECVTNLGLKLNSSKCQYVVVSLSRKPSQQEKTCLTINGAQLKQVDSYKYLGVEIDSNMTFAKQTTKAVTNAKKGIGMLCRSLRKWSSTEVLKTSFSSLVIPAIFYALEVWYPPNVKQQLKIERVQKFAGRILLNNFNHQLSYEEILDKLSWRPIFQMVAERRLLNMKKYMMALRYIPDYVFPLQQELVRRASMRQKTKKHKQQVQILKDVKNEKEGKLAAAKMRIMWNNLHEEVVTAKFSGFRKLVLNKEVFCQLCDSGAVIPLTSV